MTQVKRPFQPPKMNEQRKEERYNRIEFLVRMYVANGQACRFLFHYPPETKKKPTVFSTWRRGRVGRWEPIPEPYAGKLRRHLGSSLQNTVEYQTFDKLQNKWVRVILLK